MRRFPSRRHFLASSLAMYPLGTACATEPTRRPSGSLTDVPAVKVGHFTHRERPTGCTAVLTERGAVAGVDVRGGGPGTRETDLLKPEASVQRVHGIMLSGGSAYGLAAADGVMRYLEEREVGFPVGSGVVPIVPAAILFDLGLGDSKIRPDASSGICSGKSSYGQAGPARQRRRGSGGDGGQDVRRGTRDEGRAGFGVRAVAGGVGDRCRRCGERARRRRRPRQQHCPRRGSLGRWKSPRQHHGADPPRGQHA